MGFFADGSAALVLAHLLSTAASAIVAAVLSGGDSRDDRSRASSIGDSLASATFGDVADRRPEARGGDTCAVCLGRLRRRDLVRELRNCRHVFHRDCIDRWVDRDRPDCDHDDNRSTCPLCRAPLVTSSQSLGRAAPEPSWAVERILYLFGDDLLVY